MTIDDMKNDRIAWAHILYSVLIHHKNTGTQTQTQSQTHWVSLFWKINKMIKREEWSENGVWERIQELNYKWIDRYTPEKRFNLNIIRIYIYDFIAGAIRRKHTDVVPEDRTVYVRQLQQLMPKMRRIKRNVWTFLMNTKMFMWRHTNSNKTSKAETFL